MYTPGINLSKRAMLIINPVSGKKLVLRCIPQIVRTLMDAGYLVSVFVTAKRGDAADFAAQFGREFDLVCCTGGDGTLNETICGLAREDIRVPLGYIPCGSTNDFALSRHLSSDIPTAAKNIADGSVTRYDVGRFGDQFFSYIAAFGAFSWLSYTTDQNLKNVLGHTAYIIDGIKDVYKIKPLHVRLTADGTIHEDSYIFGAICNTTSVAGTIELPASEVDTCDGKFEVLLIKMPKTVFELDGIIRALHTQDYSISPFIDFFHAQDVEIQNFVDLEWSLDGESSGSFGRTHVSILPGFLSLQS